LMLFVHTATGCNRCDIAECRLSRAARDRKSKGQ
jgi:hypothetical protein